MKSLWFTIITLAFLAVSLGIKLIASEIPSPCRDELVDEVSTPDGTKIAYLISRDCGATTNYAYWLILEPKDSPLTKNGDEFQIEVDDPQVVFTTESQPAIGWINNQTLRVSGAYDPRKKLTNWNDVRLTYVN